MAMDEATAVNTYVEETETKIGEHSGKDDKVDWDGPNDPENPQNFPFRRKIFLTGVIILLTLNV
jgi:hypothetical protein